MKPHPDDVKALLTPARLAEIEERANAATPGKWRLGTDAQGPCMVLHPTREGVAIASLTDTFKPASGFHDDWYVYGDGGKLDEAATHARIKERNANANLIANAKDDLAALLAEVRRLQQIEMALRQALEQIAKKDTTINDGGNIYEAGGGVMDYVEPHEIAGPCAKIAKRALNPGAGT